jgi:hypothetical protein
MKAAQQFCWFHGNVNCWGLAELLEMKASRGRAPFRIDSQAFAELLKLWALSGYNFI